MNYLNKIYSLYFVYEFEDGHEDTKLLGVFSSKEKAETALLELYNQLRLQPRAKNFFVISENTLNQLGWAKGFLTF